MRSHVRPPIQMSVRTAPNARIAGSFPDETRLLIAQCLRAVQSPPRADSALPHVLLRREMPGEHLGGPLGMVEVQGPITRGLEIERESAASAKQVMT
jgi:hypothetical protein